MPSGPASFPYTSNGDGGATAHQTMSKKVGNRPCLGRGNQSKKNLTKSYEWQKIGGIVMRGREFCNLVYKLRRYYELIYLHTMEYV